MKKMHLSYGNDIFFSCLKKTSLPLLNTSNTINSFFGISYKVRRYVFISHFQKEKKTFKKGSNTQNQFTIKKKENKTVSDLFVYDYDCNCFCYSFSAPFFFLSKLNMHLVHKNAHS